MLRAEADRRPVQRDGAAAPRHGGRGEPSRGGGDRQDARGEGERGRTLTGWGNCSGSTSTTWRRSGRPGGGAFPTPPPRRDRRTVRSGRDHVHLREDRRHIQDRDLEALSGVVTTRINLEMAATEEMTRIARDFRPRSATLVPERREEITTEGGLDALSQPDVLSRTAAALKEKGLSSACSSTPTWTRSGVTRRRGGRDRDPHRRLLRCVPPGEARSGAVRIRAAASYADSLGLQVVAGHGLDSGTSCPCSRWGRYGSSTSATASSPGRCSSGWPRPSGRSPTWSTGVN